MQSNIDVCLMRNRSVSTYIAHHGLTRTCALPPKVNYVVSKLKGLHYGRNYGAFRGF